jgi:radical SAM protein with 4Fe4S-binding SPASM domain
MPFELFRNILDKFEGSYLLDLGGGEPFLHKDLFKMIKYGRKLKKIVTINTNGILIKDKIEQIISSDLSYLNISINAINSNDYRHLTNSSPNVFEEVLDNIKTIVSRRGEDGRKIRLGVSYVCTKTNYKKMPEMMRLAHELGVDEASFINLRPIPREGFTPEYCLYDDDTDVVEVIKSLDGTELKVEIKGPYLYERSPSKVKLHCFQPFTWISVYPNGDAYTCCVRIEKAGNVLYDENIWNNDAFRKFRMIMMSKNPNIIPTSCKVCPNYVGTRSWKTY